MLPSWADESVTIIEPDLIDDRGTLVPDYDHPVTTTVVGGCSVEPGASSKDQAARQNVIVRWTVLLPEGTPCSEWAQVNVRGDRYSIDGALAAWESPFGAVSHVRLLLVDWRG